MNLSIERWLIAVLISHCGTTYAQIGQHAEQTEAPTHFASLHSGRLRSLHLSGNAREVIKKALGVYGIEVVFSDAIPDGRRSIELNIRDADVTTVGEVLQAMTHCSFVPVNSHLVAVNHAAGTQGPESGRLSSETIEIPNFEAGNAQQRSDVEGILNTIFGSAKFTVHANSVSVHAEPKELSQVKRTLTNLFQPPPQLLLKVNVYIASRDYSRSVGLQTPQQVKVFNLDSEALSLISNNSDAVNQLIASGVVSAGDTLGIAEALIAEGYGSNSVLSSPFLTFGGGYTAMGVQFGSVKAIADLTASSNQQLRTCELRLANGQTATLKIGQHYPILRATTTAVGGSSSSTTPSIQYEDLGLSIEATSHVVAEGQIMFHIHESLRSLAGTNLNDIPIIDNREFISDLSVLSGMTTVVVTSLSKTDAHVTQGLSSQIPTNPEKDQQISDLVVTLTPVLVRP